MQCIVFTCDMCSQTPQVLGGLGFLGQLGNVCFALIHPIYNYGEVFVWRIAGFVPVFVVLHSLFTVEVYNSMYICMHAIHTCKLVRSFRICGTLSYNCKLNSYLTCLICLLYPSLRALAASDFPATFLFSLEYSTQMSHLLNRLFCKFHGM